MRLKAMIGICAVAIVAICVVGASSAFAELKREPTGAPEFGRCIKVAKGTTGEYSTAHCTAKEAGGKYEWYPGPGPKAKFKAEGKEEKTDEATHCVSWINQVEKENYKHATELLEAWKYSEKQCEKAVKAWKCTSWLRTGEPTPPFLVGYTSGEGKIYISPSVAECELAEKEYEQEYVKEEVVLETTFGISTKVECEKVTAEGEYNSNEKESNKLENLVAKFTNCVSKFSSSKCTSAGAAEGEIVTSDLDGELGVIEATKEAVNDQIGLSLAAASGPVAEFECGAVKVTVTGSVIHPVSTNKMVLEEVEKFSQKGGLQKPQRFEGGPLDVLETSLDGGPLFQSGEVLLATLVNEEEIEVNSVV